MNTDALSSIVKSMESQGMDIIIIQDSDIVRFLTGYCGYLGMDLGRPTLLLLSKTASLNENFKNHTCLVTPDCEKYMAEIALPDMSMKSWNDDDGWWSVLRSVLPAKGVAGVQRHLIHSIILDRLGSEESGLVLQDCSAIMDPIREVKSAEQLETMGKAGQVAIAILDGCRHAIAPGVPEWQLGMAGTCNGSAKAAELMDADVLGGARVVPGESPLISGLPILQSSQPGVPRNEDAMLCSHAKANLRRVKEGDAIFLCCCMLATYRGMHVGFDRTFFVGSLSEELRRVHDICVESQMAGLELVRPGAVCEDIHAASMAVLVKNDIEPCYRTGRSLGYAILEAPEIKAGNKTVLKEGMCICIDGAAAIPGVGTVRIGDSVRVTADGWEYLTPYEKGPIIVPTCQPCGKGSAGYVATGCAATAAAVSSTDITGTSSVAPKAH